MMELATGKPEGCNKSVPLAHANNEGF